MSIDAAALDAKVAQPRKLDAVPIAARADIADHDVAQHHMVRRRAGVPRIVDIQAISPRALKHDVAQLHMRGRSEMQSAAAAFDDRRIFCVDGSDHNRLFLRSREPRLADAALIDAGGDADCGSGFGTPKRGDKLITIGNADFFGRRGR
jgi:hypothetical protein